MIKIKDLPERWQSSATQRKTRRRYEISLILRDAARIEALQEVYPDTSVEQVISDLLSAALNQLEAELPYRPGPRVIATDEFGEPVFEDIGPSPRFQQATKRWLEQLETEDANPSGQ